MMECLSWLHDRHAARPRCEDDMAPRFARHERAPRAAAAPEGACQRQTRARRGRRCARRTDRLWDVHPRTLRRRPRPRAWPRQRIRSSAPSREAKELLCACRKSPLHDHIAGRPTPAVVLSQTALLALRPFAWPMISTESDMTLRRRKVSCSRKITTARSVHVQHLGVSSASCAGTASARRTWLIRCYERDQRSRGKAHRRVAGLPTFLWTALRTHKHPRAKTRFRAWAHPRTKPVTHRARPAPPPRRDARPDTSAAPAPRARRPSSPPSSDAASASAAMGTNVRARRGPNRGY